MSLGVQPATFRSEDVERCGHGAGVVPIARSPDGEAHVLLGRERFLPQWKGSCRWSGFEGSRKESETLMDTAVRECVEESLASVGAPAALRARLTAGEFWVRVVLRIHTERRPPAPERYHSTHVVPVPWDEALPERFQARRHAIEVVDRNVQELRHTRPACLGTEDVGPIVDEPGGGLRVARVAAHAPCILHAPWTSDPDDPELVRAVLLPDDPECERLSAWRARRERLERSLVAHPGVRVRRDARWGLVQDVHVVKDFLEKDQVRWWSVHELWRVLGNRGQLGTDRFRPYFLPVLQTVLNELDASPPAWPAPRLPPGLQCAPAQPDP